MNLFKRDEVKDEQGRENNCVAADRDGNSWPSFGWPALALFVLYLFSSGPAYWLCLRFNGGSIPIAYGIVYAPVFWACWLWPPLNNALLQYDAWWAAYR
jgi:hypothetical protein